MRLRAFGILCGVAVAAAGAALAQAVPPAFQRAAQLPGMFGALVLQGGFSPDPAEVAVEAGGAFEAGDLDAACAGKFNGEAPDVTLEFSRPAGPLNIYVIAEEDTALVVRRPNGTWVCDDDTFELNPLVHLEKPASGRYAIWVATFGSGYPRARVLISENEPRWEELMGAGPGDTEAPPTPEELGLVAIELPAGTRAAEMLAALTEPLDGVLGAEGLVLGLTAPARFAEANGETRITLPGLTMAGRDTGQARFGDVTFSLRPRAGGPLRNLFDFGIDLPRRIEAADGGQVLGAVQLAPSRISGTWSSSLQTLLALDAGIGDLALTETVDRRERTIAKLGELRVTRSLAPDTTGGLWSGNYGVTLRGLDLTPNATSRLAIERLTVGGTLADADVQKVAELNANYGIDPILGGIEALEAVDLSDYLDALLELAWGRYAASFAVTNLVTRDGPGEYTLGTAEARLGVDLSGVLAQIDVGLTVAGLGEGGAGALPVELWPRSVAIDASVVNAPLKPLVTELLWQTVGLGIDRDEALSFLIPDLANLAHPRLIVRSATIKSDVIEVTANGVLELAPDTGVEPTAVFEATVKGMGRAVEVVRANQRTLPEAAEALRQLIALQGLGVAEVEGGAVVHRFHIVMQPSGKIIVNGTDLDTMR